jgi:GTP-binding protein Era
LISSPSSSFFEQKEIPYSSEIVIEDFKDISDSFSVIQANVVVERKTQMPIIIGAGGTKIKALKDLAQKKLEEVGLKQQI